MGLFHRVMLTSRLPRFVMSSFSCAESLAWYRACQSCAVCAQSPEDLPAQVALTKLEVESACVYGVWSSCSSLRVSGCCYLMR